MSSSSDPQILLTNDDGIKSPGLWAAAEALSGLGFVTVAAPRDQASGSGRSKPQISDGAINEEELNVKGQRWKVYAVGGSPAQAVQHGILELMPRQPDLVVAGINYGENVTTSITVSGTVGAAMEGAALGIPSLAVSLETDREFHLSYSRDIDFSAASHFLAIFARLLLDGFHAEDIDLLKVDVPSNATTETPWQITRLSRGRYYLPKKPVRERLDAPADLDYEVVGDLSEHGDDSDAHVLRVERRVAVTPISLDMTSRVGLGDLDKRLRQAMDDA
ncbi:MAG: 5'/3'-nucleotidase SurE [Anaerolineales bacterium]|jgi:5'-nucleotidase